MTLFYYNPELAEHATGDHPESPNRVLFTAQHFAKIGLLDRLTRPAWEAISPARLGHVHPPAYLTQLEQFCAAGGGYLDSDTVCSQRSYDVARLAAGAVADAVDRVLAGQDRQAFCLVRPPGHHALAAEAMGFCLLNNIAVGASLALAEFDLRSVLVVDWDVHHGNGTQAIFWENQQVGFLSIHRWPFYPGSGRADETGGGAALGTKANLPIEFGTSRREYFERFRNGVEQLADKIRPELVLISAGFDAHRDDPIGSLGLETEDFATLSQIVRGVADVHAQGRIVSVLEGGYNLAALADCVAVHLEDLLGTP